MPRARSSSPTMNGQKSSNSAKVRTDVLARGKSAGGAGQAGPREVGEGDEQEPRHAGFERDFEFGDPPGGNEDGGEGEETEQGGPRPWRSKTQVGYSRTLEALAENKVRDKNHQPDEQSAEECRADHVGENSGSLKPLLQNER